MTAVGEARLRQLEEENRELRAALALRDRLPTRAITAEVIGRSLLPWEGNLLLGIGAADGVEPHMVALTPDGVLGQVTTVTAHTAEILPLTDPQSGIAAMTERTKSPGVLKGDRDGKCQLNYLSGDADVKPGDRVLTSGLGEYFARGLPLGAISEVTNNTTLSSRIATITPTVNPATVVLVVLVKMSGDGK